jgi:hypothetical protein
MSLRADFYVFLTIVTVNEIISLNNSNRFVFVMETLCAPCEVRIDYISTA